MTRSLRLPLLLAAALIAVGASAGCDTVDELLGRGGKSEGETLRITSIAITSDHPVDPLVPGGPALATTAGLIRFIATGTFISLNGGATSTQDVSSAVLWESTAPSVALPGADGRVALVSTAAGAATISASTPAHDDIPALESNAIVFTVN